MSINLDVATIATNLASLWSSLTPPTGLDAITLATYKLPNEIGGTPVLLVKPPTGDFEYGPGQMEGELVFPVEFYLTEGADLPANATKLYAWYSTLFAAPEANYNLSAASGVVDVTLTGSRMGTLSYGGKVPKDYVGIQFEARVRVKLGYNAVGH